MLTIAVKGEHLGAFIAHDARCFKDGEFFRHIALTLPPNEDRTPFGKTNVVKRLECQRSTFQE